MGQKQTRFSSADLQEVLNGTKFTKEEITQWFAKFKNEFPRGKIWKYEFLVMYTKLFPHGDATEFTDHIFRTYDIDGNGIIDFLEFMTTVSIAQRGTVEEQLKWAFRLYDLDGDGKLTPKEIETVLKAIYKARNISDPKKIETSIRDIFSNLDSNDDGYISEEEFVQEISKCPSLKELLQGF